MANYHEKSIKILFFLFHARSYIWLTFFHVCYYYTCSYMHDGGVSWLHSAEVVTSGTEIFLLLVNIILFLRHLLHESADGAIACYRTHTVYTYNIILIHSFFLLIEMHMYGWVTFSVTEHHILASNYAASKALGLNSLLSYSFTLYYFTLE